MKKNNLAIIILGWTILGILGMSGCGAKKILNEKELLENEQLKSYLAESMKTEKAIEFIVKNAKIK